MKQPEADRIAHFVGSPTREELLPLVRAVFNLQATVVELGLALSDAGQNQKVMTILRGTIASSDEMAALIREMVNAGVDSEWDHRA